MSTIWWAGIAIDPDTQGRQMAESLSIDVDQLLGDADGGEKFATICEPDGSEKRRYRFGPLVITEIVDRLGQRIGCGIEACDQQDATLQLERVRKFLRAWNIEARASVWQWSRMTVPAEHPLRVDARATGIGA